MKPRLRNDLLEEVFKQYFSIFSFAFEGCQIEFKREIFLKSHFRYYPPEESANPFKDLDEYENSDIFNQKDDPPVIEEANKFSKKVHFIYTGTIHLMNRTGMYEYGTIGEGSYFGDISLLLNEENEFSY